MTAAEPAGFLLERPGLAIVAAAVGVAIAIAYLAADYLLNPALRLRRARRRGPASIAALIGSEAARLRRFYDRAAVLEEHGHPDARALGEEADLRAAAFAAVLGRAGPHRDAARRAASPKPFLGRRAPRAPRRGRRT